MPPGTGRATAARPARSAPGHDGERSPRPGRRRLGNLDVLRFPATPLPDATTYTTFGLSRAELHLGASSHIRLELLLSLENEPDPLAAALWLVTLAEHFVESGFAPKLAEVHRMGELAQGSAMEGFALVQPVRFDEDFALVQPWGDGVSVAVLELVPLSTVEAGLVSTYGWDQFVTVIERNEPNFLDLHRPELLRRLTADSSAGEELSYRYFEADGTAAPSELDAPGGPFIG